MRSHLFVLVGQTPVPEDDALKWAAWLCNSERARVVQQTRIGATLVSTIFTGLDFSSGNSRPMLFETLVLEDGKTEVDGRRCSTWLEAEEQHADIVEEVELRSLR